MMDLFLPGRSPDPEDYEAQCALRTLLEADKLKGSADEALLSRVAEQIQHNLDMLQRVSGLVDSLRSGDDESEDSPEAPLFTDSDSKAERTDTRTIEDFLLRANRARRVENRKTEKPMGRGRSYV